MSTNLLASGSAKVKVWNLSPSLATIEKNDSTTTNKAPEQLVGLEKVSFSPLGSTAVNCVRWSQDHKHLAVVGNEGGISIHDQNGTRLHSIPLNVTEESVYPTINALRFASKSRYILFGGTDKDVHIWDREQQAYADPLQGHRSTITSLDLNLDENLVASSNSGGNIIVHNRRQASSNNLIVLTSQPINILEYSYYKPGLLAAGGDDCHLRLWDTSASTTALQTFENVHHQSIKGIAFSPQNSSLMCSSGLDKRIVLYDVGKKVSLKTLYTDSPLTTLAFKPDGFTLAAGTMQGDIIVYDLRSLSKPMGLLLGTEHHPIQSLHFQDKEKIHEPRILSRQKSNTRTSFRGTPPPKPRVNVPSVTNESQEKNYMEMFSPVKGELTDDGKRPEIDSIRRDTDMLSTGAIDGLKTRIVSEAREIIGGVRSLSIGCADSVLPNITPQKRVAFSEDEVISESQGRLTNNKRPRQQFIEQSLMKDAPAEKQSIILSPEEIQPPPLDPFKTPLTDISTSSSNVSNSTPAKPNDNITPPTFQYQVLENIVDDCFQEFKISLRNDIQNMHLELIRQFYIQKTEMEMISFFKVT
ncbi:hypothetical protein G9A89_004251 [Geosiphon pyriformis]|nr:hypothetical protein G9A89_004251 [Geosiphon pyriformis]